MQRTVVLAGVGLGLVVGTFAIGALLAIEPASELGAARPWRFAFGVTAGIVASGLGLRYGDRVRYAPSLPWRLVASMGVVGTLMWWAIFLGYLIIATLVGAPSWIAITLTIGVLTALYLAIVTLPFALGAAFIWAACIRWRRPSAGDASASPRGGP
jgi:hypothetical protein